MKWKCASAVCVSCVTLMNLSSSSASSSPLFALYSSSSFSLLPSLFWACLSRCCAARREDTLTLSLLGRRSGTSLWGARALTLSQHQLVLSCWLVLMLLSDWFPAGLSNKLRMELRWLYSEIRFAEADGRRWRVDFFRLISILSLILIFFFSPAKLSSCQTAGGKESEGEWFSRLLPSDLEWGQRQGQWRTCLVHPLRSPSVPSQDSHPQCFAHLQPTETAFSQQRQLLSALQRRDEQQSRHQL